MHTVYRQHTGALEYTREPLSPDQCETFTHACTVLRFVVAPGERITMGEWCERIARHYAPSGKRDACIAAIRAAGGVRSFWVSVLRPIGPMHVVHVYHVECAAPIEWVREHADEIAQRQGHAIGTYDALMVRDYMPADECAAL